MGWAIPPHFLSIRRHVTVKDLWSDLCIAVGNPNRYGELLKNRTRRIAGLMAILILISSVFGVIFPLAEAAKGLSVIFTDEFPDFTLSEQGFEIGKTVELDAGITLFRATNEKLTERSDLDGYLSAIVLDPEKAVVKNGDQTAAFYFSDLDSDFLFQKSDLERFRPIYYGILAVSGVLMVLFMIATLFLAALLLRGGEKAKQIRFEGCFRLALYARALPVLLGIVLNFFGIILFPVLSLAISCVMMWFAFRAMNQNELPEEKNLERIFIIFQKTLDNC